MVFDAISNIWKILAALSLISDSVFAFWNARVVLPMSEGLEFLPIAMVVSVWVDVAASTMSRLKVNLTAAHTSFWGDSPRLQAHAQQVVLCPLRRKQNRHLSGTIIRPLHSDDFCASPLTI